MLFICDEVQKVAVANLLTTASQSFANPASEETLIVSACRVLAIPSPTSPRLWEPQQPASGTFRAAIGLPTQAPIAGVFFIGWGTKTSGTITTGKRYEILDFIAGDDFTNVGGTNVDGSIFTATGTTPTTWTHSSLLTEISADLAYTATAAQIQTAMLAMASIAAAGNVTVTLNGASFLIAWTLVGSREEISADATNLAPAGTVAEIGTELDGSSTVREVQFLRFVQSPAAFVDLTVAAPAAAGTVDVLTVGDPGPPAVNAAYLVTLYTSELNQAYDGLFSITVLGATSPLIAFDASAEDTQAALESMTIIGTGNVSVSRPSQGKYIIGFQDDLAGTNTGTMTVDVSALETIPFLTGELDLADPGIQLLFGTATTTTAIFVIEYTPSGGSRREIFRRSITLDQSLIPEGALTPTPRISFYTKAETDAAIAAAVGALVFGTIASQDANNVTITGGTVDNVTITNAATVNALAISDNGATGIAITNSLTATSIGLAAGCLLSLGSGSTMVVAAGRDVVFSNTLTFAGTNGSTLNISTGGTLGTAAFTAATAYIASGAASTGTGNLVRQTTPTLTTPVLGAATGTSIVLSGALTAATVALSGSSTAVSFTLSGTLTTAGRREAYVSKTSTYSISHLDYMIECLSGTFTATLPSAIGFAGEVHAIRNSGAGTITLATTSAQTISPLGGAPATTVTLATTTARTVMSDGANWIEF